MRYLLVLCLFVGLVGCGSTRIKPSNIEHCSLQGKDLYPAGVATGSSSDFTYGVVGGRTVSGTTSSSSRSVMCGKAANKYELCLSRKMKESGLVIEEYNDGAGAREFWTGLGYVYLFPGFIGMSINNSNNQEKMKEVNKVRTLAMDYCSKYRPDSDVI